MATRCCSPPESSRGKAVALDASPTCVRRAAYAWRDLPLRCAGHFKGKSDVAFCGAIFEQAKILEDDPYTAAQLGHLFARGATRAHSAGAHLTLRLAAHPYR